MTSASTTQGQELANLYDRELGNLLDMLADYDDDDLWSTRGAQRNSPGNLALHLAGNLLHFVGALLGGSGYERDRAAEFSERVDRKTLVARVEAARAVVVEVLAGIGDEEMEAAFPGDIPPVYEGMNTRSFLIHLLWHLGWHQGHIYYHRLGGTHRQ